jgi:hypothetical protein
VTAKNVTAHMSRKKNTEPERTLSENCKVGAAREPADFRELDGFWGQQLKRLATADFAQALAPNLKRNARGLGAFVAAKAAELGTTSDAILADLENRLRAYGVGGKPVEAEAEANLLADPDELYDAAAGWVTTWRYFDKYIAKQIRLRHMTAKRIRPGEVGNHHKRKDNR